MFFLFFLYQYNVRQIKKKVNSQQPNNKFRRVNLIQEHSLRYILCLDLQQSRVKQLFRLHLISKNYFWIWNVIDNQTHRWNFQVINPIRILTEQSTHSLKSTVNSINNIRNSYGN